MCHIIIIDNKSRYNYKYIIFLVDPLSRYKYIITLSNIYILYRYKLYRYMLYLYNINKLNE